MKKRYQVIQSFQEIETDRVAYMLENMVYNRAYQFAVEQTTIVDHEEMLQTHRERFKDYRLKWKGNPQEAFENRLHHEPLREAGLNPLCVDIEVSSMCDLACSFCYRHSILTPDRFIKEDLFYRLIDQCAELEVPSVKLNWRGEPLLHPKLTHFVEYAKMAGILETIINTNAVTLTEEKSGELIKAGLDLMIYSFDGGSKESYERLRPGRFKENTFEAVYENIRRFARIRAEMGAKFPRTKIQMILTKDTFGEQEAFFNLFSDYVDDVSVKAYTERGGSMADLDEVSSKRLLKFFNTRGLPDSTPYWRDMEGNLFVSTERLPCEQPFQRLTVAYDGRVSMCCYDWGSEYPIGYVDRRVIVDGDAAYTEVLQKVEMKARGFERFGSLRMPNRYLSPPKSICSLEEIWHGDIVNNVREKHVQGQLEQVPVCRLCPFKETYNWLAVEM